MNPNNHCIWGWILPHTNNLIWISNDCKDHPVEFPQGELSLFQLHGIWYSLGPCRLERNRNHVEAVADSNDGSCIIFLLKALSDLQSAARICHGNSCPPTNLVNLARDLCNTRICHIELGLTLGAENLDMWDCLKDLKAGYTWLPQHIHWFIIIFPHSVGMYLHFKMVIWLGKPRLPGQPIWLMSLFVKSI